MKRCHVSGVSGFPCFKERATHNGISNFAEDDPVGRKPERFFNRFVGKLFRHDKPGFHSGFTLDFVSVFDDIKIIFRGELDHFVQDRIRERRLSASGCTGNHNICTVFNKTDDAIVLRLCHLPVLDIFFERIDDFRRFSDLQFRPTGVRLHKRGKARVVHGNMCFENWKAAVDIERPPGNCCRSFYDALNDIIRKYDTRKISGLPKSRNNNFSRIGQ